MDIENIVKIKESNNIINVSSTTNIIDSLRMLIEATVHIAEKLTLSKKEIIDIFSECAEGIYSHSITIELNNEVFENLMKGKEDDGE